MKFRAVFALLALLLFAPAFDAPRAPQAAADKKDVAAEQIFDFRFVREVYKELRDMGWERALRATK